MKGTIKNSIAGLLAGAIMSIGVLGVASVVKEDVSCELPSDFSIEKYVDISSLKGEQGERGLRGFPGKDGRDGVDGKDGKDAVINMPLLVDQVADELEARDEAPVFLQNGVAGNFSYDLVIDEDATYTFTLLHFGSGDFEVSLVDEDDNVDVIVNTHGHADKIKTRSLEEGTYTLRISADGDWKIKTEK